MKKKTTKVTIGIDIAKDSFTACVASLNQSFDVELSEVKEFKNNKTGFNQLVKWSRKFNKELLPMNYVMEATGVYHENLAYHLDKLNITLSIVLPNKIKHFAKSHNVKTKNDFIDARLIALFGSKRILDTWKKPTPIFKRLKHLVRLHQQLTKQKLQINNILHCEKHSYDVPKFVSKSNTKILKTIEKEIAKVKAQIEVEVVNEPWLDKKIKQITTIKGIALFSVVTIIAETNGFEMFNSIKQVVSYAGLDVVETKSGTSVNKTPRISKKGNKHMRRALYLPAVSAARFNPEIKTFYERVNKGKKSKKVGLIAVERKLLALIYTLWKNNTCYDPNYKKNRASDSERKTDNPSELSALDSSFSKFEQETSFV